MAALQALSASAAFNSLAYVAPVSQKLTVANFNGLKASPVRKQRPAVVRLIASSRHPLGISASADAETFQVVSAVIAEQLAIDVAEVQAESKLAELGADSLDMVEIMMALEERFDIQLQDDNAEQIVTIQHAADLIQEVVAAQKR